VSANESAARRAGDSVIVREYVAGRDDEALRACIIELQEWERGFEPSMPEGRAMVDAYVALQLARCGTWDGAILLAQQAAGEIVGYACVWAHVPSDEPDDDPHDYGYLADLLVRRPHRRKGVGRVLLRAAEEFARTRGARVMRVGVLARNRDARAFYYDHGFGDQQIEMAKPLGD
jgi:ribosomal protein S18 acetylase RimI-like enzyme